MTTEEAMRIVDEKNLGQLRRKDSGNCFDVGTVGRRCFVVPALQ